MSPMKVSYMPCSVLGKTITEQQQRQKGSCRMKKIALMIVVCMMLTIGTFAVCFAEDQVLAYQTETQTYSSVEGTDNDALFGEYAERFFTNDEIISRDVSDDRLEGTTRSVYRILRSMIADVAEGSSLSTVFEIPFGDVGLQSVFTAADLGVASIIEDGAIANAAVQAAGQYLAVDLNAVVKLLLANAPYELYWYNKTKGVQFSTGGFSAYYDSNVEDYVLEATGNYTFSFSVAEGYAAGSYIVDSTPVTTARNAASHARAIVGEYALASDYEKLLGYKNEICELVAYNFSAANNNTTAYGDPWQLIWVFDGDESTSVVCEGYAKAFQYLCDQTSFSDPLVNCYSVTGTMSGGTGAGAHMWNLVKMQNGNVYLADVTNCDTGSIGADNLLFLAGYDSGDMENGYAFSCGGTDAVYIYDAETIDLFTEDELTVFEMDYTEEVLPYDQYAIDERNYPDAVFRAYVSAYEEEYGNGDGTWTDEEIGQVQEIDVPYKNIRSLQGIEHFYALTNLICSGNQLTALDLSGNPELTEVFCYDNPMTTLNVSENPALWFLSCRNCQLTVLDLSGNPTLNYLDCIGNRLTELNLYPNPSLQNLYCGKNLLTTLDLSRNPEMQYLGCNDNQLTELNVWGLTNLKYLGCHGNELSSLDVRNNAFLEQLACYNNDISVLDISENQRIVENVNDEHYQLFDDNTVRYGDKGINSETFPYLWCDAEVQLIVQPFGTAIDETRFPDANFRAFVFELEEKYGNGDGEWSKHEIRQVVSMDVSSHNIQSLQGIELFSSLQYLFCGNNELITLNVSGNTALEGLQCEDNQLTELYVSGIPSLKYLLCSNNRLTVLDTSGSPSLLCLDCSDNRLTALDLSNNARIQQLACCRNEISTLDISENPRISILVNDDHYHLLQDETIRYCNNDNYYAGYPYFWYDAAVELIAGTSAPGIAIDETNFPDANFRAYVLELEETQGNGDGIWTENEIRFVNQLNVTSRDIQSLLGIEIFPELSYLNCNENRLTTLDVSQNPALVSLWCEKNALTMLDLRWNPALTILFCDENRLVMLEVGGAVGLRDLYCGENELTTLDVSGNPALEKLGCGNNLLNELDLSMNTALTSLQCYDNHLTRLDVSNSPALKTLECGANQLTVLDVSNMTMLEGLWCQYNQLTSLDVSGTIALNHLDCADNQLRTLDLSECAALETLYCLRNQLITLNMSGTESLKIFDARDNQLRELDVSGSPELEYLECDCNQLITLNVGTKTALSKLYCGDNLLTTLDVSGIPSLTILHCYENNLSSLDVSQNPALQWLRCDTNELTELDVSENPDLLGISCERNQLTMLDVSRNSQMYQLACQNNLISVLDISTIPSIAQVVNEHFFNECEDDTVLYSNEPENYISGPFLWCDEAVWIIGGSPVVTDSAFDNLATLILPASILEIEDESFMHLSMQAVIIPDGCLSIGSKAFAGNPQLLYVRIPASVTYIANDAFDACPSVWIDYVQ